MSDRKVKKVPRKGGTFAQSLSRRLTRAGFITQPSYRKGRKPGIFIQASENDADIVLDFDNGIRARDYLEDVQQHLKQFGLEYWTVPLDDDRPDMPRGFVIRVYNPRQKPGDLSYAVLATLPATRSEERAKSQLERVRALLKENFPDLDVDFSLLLTTEPSPEATSVDSGGTGNA